MNNDTTRKHPRTMQEAFGPYAGSDVEDGNYLYTPTEIVMMGLGLIVLVLAGVCLVFWFALT
jgi:hypothetical protein